MKAYYKWILVFISYLLGRMNKDPGVERLNTNASELRLMQPCCNKKHSSRLCVVNGQLWWGKYSTSLILKCSHL